MSKKNKRITSGGARNSSGQTLIMTKPRIFALDIGDYVKAIDSANDLDYYNRTRLYDLYTSIMMDGHLKAVIGKRKASALSVPIVFMRDGKVDEQITELIKSSWFDDLLDNALDATYYGFTLLQLFQGRDGWLNAEMIPRKHVDPERRLILRQQHDTSGASWDEFPNMLFIGSSRDLGLLACAAPYALYKRNSLADWAQFSEVFGMPIREYTYNAGDEETRASLLRDARTQGSNAVYVHPKESELNIIQAGDKAGSSELFREFAAYWDNEMSIRVLGNTLTTSTQGTGTYAQAKVHQEGEEEMQMDDCAYILDVLNYQLTPILEALGIPLSGGKFVYAKEERIDVTQQMDIVLKAHSMGVPISDEYIYALTGIDKPENYDELVRQQEAAIKETAKKLKEQMSSAEDDSKGNKTSLKQRLGSFFGLAPQDGADSGSW